MFCSRLNDGRVHDTTQASKQQFKLFFSVVLVSRGGGCAYWLRLASKGNTDGSGKERARARCSPSPSLTRERHTTKTLYPCCASEGQSGYLPSLLFLLTACLPSAGARPAAAFADHPAVSSSTPSAISPPAISLACVVAQQNPCKYNAGCGPCRLLLY